jgi:hypothetical protein
MKNRQVMMADQNDMITIGSRRSRLKAVLSPAEAGSK